MLNCTLFIILDKWSEQTLAIVGGVLIIWSVFDKNFMRHKFLTTMTSVISQKQNDSDGSQKF